MKDLHARKPIDKTSAVVTSQGPDYQLTNYKPPSTWDKDTPYVVLHCPTNIKDLTGEKFGRLTVLGYYGTRTSGKKKVVQHTKWVVRCVCGMYSIRTNKSIERKSNPDECCGRCEYLKIIRKRSNSVSENSAATEQIKILPLPPNADGRIIGEVFDYLRVIGYGGSNGRGAKWVVKCILCNAKQYREARDLRKGRTKCQTCCE